MGKASSICKVALVPLRDSVVEVDKYAYTDNTDSIIFSMLLMYWTDKNRILYVYLRANSSVTTYAGPSVP